MRTSTEHLPGLTLTNLTLEVPLVHDDPARGTIEVFARVATASDGADKPYLVFLQGGPGSEAPRPSLIPTNPSWLGRVIAEYQVVMLDQRGTGRSTPIGTTVRREGDRTVARPIAPLDTLDAAAAAEYLTHFRADEIVNDCEAVRQALGAERWTVLGQSFGGFTSLHYLSTHPESLDAVLSTGGLSAVQHPIDDVYTETWRIMTAKSEQFYRLFPGDRDAMRALSARCAAGEITLPNGDVVSPARLRTLGLRIGMQGGFETLHYLLGLDPDAPAFAHDLASLLPFGGRNPLYAVLHESSYADGVPTRWSAERTMPEAVRDDVTLLAGEHLPRSVFAEDTELTPFAEVADLLAEHEWNQLYFPERLREADVPVAAAIYHDDAYVPYRFSMETASLLPDCRPWITSEFEHNGLRFGDVVGHLIDLAKGRRWQ